MLGRVFDLFECLEKILLLFVKTLAESGIDGVELCRPNDIGGTSKTSKTSRTAMPLLIIVQRVIHRLHRKCPSPATHHETNVR
jgi:hypothetical protein